MVGEKYYKAIVQAKSAIADMLEDKNEARVTMGEYLSDPYYAQEAADMVSRWLWTQSSMIARIALATVLATGAFDEGNGTFYMPATGDCCRNYRAVRQMLKHHKHIDVFVYGASYDCSEPENWVIRFM